MSARLAVRRLGVRPISILCLILLSISACFAQTAAEPPASPKKSDSTSTNFMPLQQWKAAILKANAAQLKTLYSSGEESEIVTAAGASTVDAEANFWAGLRVRNMKFDVLQSDTPLPHTQQIMLQIELHTATDPQTQYVTQAQLWQEEGTQWRIIKSRRSLPAHLQQPASMKKEIYREGVNAHEEIKEALNKASKDHRNVIVVFGANWCYDCHVLDLAFQRPDLAPILARNYEVIHVDVGQGDKNQDLMNQYEVPMKKGIPGLAVLDSDGKLLTSQKNGEFENARNLAPKDLLQFLNKWKPSEASAKTMQ